MAGLQILLFTNPATVEGTMKWLNEYASAHEKQYKMISVVQLSMVQAAVNVEQEMNVQIGNPLKTLEAYLKSR